MNKILLVDDRLGLVTIEPGVTSGQLIEYLEKNEINFTGPVTGAGPTCSIIGNLLERGHGSDISVDRFASLMGLQAVLGDGTVYTSSSTSNGQPAFFKWGVGPYIDGLFGQSNFGIVVNATIALAPRPAHMETFLFSIKAEVSLSRVVESVRKVLLKLGSTLSSIEIQNGHRVITRVRHYSPAHVGEDGLLTDEYISKTLQDLSLTEWTVTGLLQGDAEIVRASRGIVKETFNYSTRRIFFFHKTSLSLIKVISKHLPIRSLKSFLNTVEKLRLIPSDVTLDEMKLGIPNFPLWKIAQDSLPQKTIKGDAETDFSLNPRCGLLYFSPVLPMLGENIETFITGAERICKNYGSEPFIRLLNFSDRCIFAPLPLLFDKSIEQEVESSRQCYNELLRLSLDCGGYVYRGTIHSMDSLLYDNPDFFSTVGKIKDALDPLGIISPGRYSCRK